MTGGQIPLFASLGRDSLPSRSVEALASDGAAVSPTPARSGDSCRECGSTVDVFYGCCADCFAAWKAAA